MAVLTTSINLISLIPSAKLIIKVLSIRHGLHVLIALPALVLNHAKFVEENRYFEQRKFNSVLKTVLSSSPNS